MNVINRVTKCTIREMMKRHGTVIGQDDKIVFVRHSSIYVRVSPCRFIWCVTEFSVEGNKGTRNKEQNESNRLS